MDTNPDPMDPIQSLSEDPISRLGPLPLCKVSPSQSLREAVAVMQEARSGSVLVCDDDGKPCGVMTERDVLRWLGTAQPLDVSVEAVASKTVYTLRSSDSVGDALQLMNRHQCRHLTVVDGDGVAVGVLSVRVIVGSLVELFPSSVYNLPPKADQVQRGREGA